MLKTILATAALLGLSAAPAVAAPANPASGLSVTARAASPSAKPSKLAGAGLVPVLIGAAVLVGAIVLIADGDDSDSN